MSVHAKFPYEQVPPSYSAAITQLLQSLASEEESLAKLMRTEADKTSSFVGRDLDFPTAPTTQEILVYNHSVIQFLDSMVMTQWLMLKKLHAISHMQFLQTRSPALLKEGEADNIMELENLEYEHFDY
ncbi:hypothetical protein HZF08_25200 [Paenibacillus sp. CGMCC 1.16610]|uniref:Uncharacterized protein n=1 Tax=Paenibacillus anseongense TaxID=2682845 RepID=A0ABW9UN13_9BACL|nr:MULTISPECIES: hypothetical protein [Paenibacillus]MBA2941588.1 hypothetical protein [Paenibacillus sp. CGMCC 1.16610]MVQ40401.1 hypothetical protein [Paenibacillus anseongense]